MTAEGMSDPIRGFGFPEQVPALLQLQRTATRAIFPRIERADAAQDMRDRALR